MEKIYDVAIIGAGPGGYVAAIRASQLGLSACVVEKDTPGGICLNWGCIPSKSLIHQASEFAALADMEKLGIRVDRSGFQYGRVQAKSRDAAKTLARGVAGLLKKNKVDVLSAVGSIAAVGKVALKGGSLDGKIVHAKNIILATGSRPLELSGFAIDETMVLSSTGILAMVELPKELVILGAGAIGCEFAYVMNAFGVKVTLVEMAGHILPSEDFEVAQVVDAAFRKAGIDILVGTKAVSWKTRNGRAAVSIDKGGQKSELCCDKMLAAFGRVPNTQGIGLEMVGVRLNERGYIETGDYGQANIPGIFAIGDITTSQALAHVASKEGEIAVEFIAGRTPRPSKVAPDLVPSAVYCEPQVAGFGLREDGDKVTNRNVKKSVFPYRGAGKSVATGKTEGLVKILADVDTGEILGAHVVGLNATELIHELLLAKSSEMVVEDIAAMIHAHPTLSEAVMEAARGINDSPIHL
jgi:dihydrolipoamide dehydrogenase